VRARLGEAFAPEETPVGVVLTGGSSRMPGMDEAAGKVFGVTGRLGEPAPWLTDELRDPGFSTPVGLLYFGLNSQAERLPAARRTNGLLHNLKRILVAS